MDLGRKWLVDQFNKNCAFDVKMDGLVLEMKSSSKIQGLFFCSIFDWGSYIISIAKTVSKKIRSLIRSMKFLSPEVALFLHKSTKRPTNLSINLPYNSVKYGC